MYNVLSTDHEDVMSLLQGKALGLREVKYILLVHPSIIRRGVKILKQDPLSPKPRLLSP